MRAARISRGRFRTPRRAREAGGHVGPRRRGGDGEAREIEAKSNAGGSTRRAAGEANGATDETLAEMGAAVARASASAPEAVAAAVAAAPPEHQTALRALVGS